MNQTLKKVIFFPITKIALGIIICLSVLIGVQNFISKPLVYKLITSKEIADSIINYTSVFVLLGTYYYLFKFYEQRKITELSRKKMLVELFLGILLGFGTLSLVILTLYLFGYYQITEFTGYNYFLSPLSFLIIAVLLEEVLFRTILYRVIENWKGTLIALVVISFAFEIPHIFNNNVSFLSVILGLLFGFAHGIMFTYTKRIWLPFAFHLAWNFAQPFYGSNLSGLDTVGYIFKAKFNGPLILTGSVYGIEDSILSIVFLFIICFIFFYLSLRENKLVPLK